MSERTFHGTNHNYWFDYLTIYPEQGITIDPNYHYIDLVKQAGFNSFRQAMVTTDAPTRPPFSALRQACLEKGIFFDFCVVCREFPAEWGTTGIPMYKQKVMAILNTDDLLNPVPIGSGGWGDLWIDEIAETVRLYQPDGVDVLNEPFDWANVISRFPEFTDLSNDDDLFNKYRNFCERAIVRFRQEKPDVLIFINPIPFWDSRRIAADPIVGENLIYDVHYYYSFEGNYPPDWLPWDQAYWNGNFEKGKQGLYEHWDTKLHGPLADAGLTVWMRELGSHQKNPNWKIWMYDAMEYCRIRGHSFNIHEFVPYPRIGDGLLTSDWTQLSEYGIFCTDYIKQLGGEEMVKIKNVRGSEITVAVVKEPVTLQPGEEAEVTVAADERIEIG